MLCTLKENGRIAPWFGANRRNNAWSEHSILAYGLRGACLRLGSTQAAAAAATRGTRRWPRCDTVSGDKCLGLAVVATFVARVVVDGERVEGGPRALLFNHEGAERHTHVSHLAPVFAPPVQRPRGGCGARHSATPSCQHVPQGKQKETLMTRARMRTMRTRTQCAHAHARARTCTAWANGSATHELRTIQ